MIYKKQYKNTNIFFILAAVLLFGLASCDGSESPGLTQIRQEAENYAGPDYTQVISVGEVRDGAAFGDLVMGNPDAPVTVTEYASLTCSHCGKFHKVVFKDFRDLFIRTGKVRFVYRNFTRDPADLAVGMLTRCFGPEQAFDMMGIYFERQRQWVQEDAKAEIAAIARRIGINRAEFDACQANTDLQRNLIEMLQEGQARGVEGTPTFFIGDEKRVGEIELAELADLVYDNM